MAQPMKSAGIRPGGGRDRQSTSGSKSSLSLDIPDLNDLDDFDSQKQTPRRVHGPANDRERRAIDRASSFPSREISEEVSLFVRLPYETRERFKRLCKTERYKYGDMLAILMDEFEGPK
ncbi:MAG: hypothetical protein ACFBSD_10880 [Paracoccaceae bacterium]